MKIETKSFRLSQKEYFKIITWYNLKGQLLPLLILLIICVIFFFISTVFLFLGIVIIILLLLSFLIIWKRLNPKENKALYTDVYYLFDNDFATICWGEGCLSKIRWNYFTKAENWQKYILLFPQKNMFYIVPKFVFNSIEVCNQFIEFLKGDSLLKSGWQIYYAT